MALDLLRSRYALTPAALAAPLDAVRILFRREETGRALEVLDETVSGYRRLMERYPRGEHTELLHLHLSEALELQGRTEEAFAHRLAWIEPVRATAAELPRLAVTAQAGRRMLRPDEEIRPLLRRMASLFGQTRLGRRADRSLTSGDR